MVLPSSHSSHNGGGSVRTTEGLDSREAARNCYSAISLTGSRVVEDK